MHDQLIDFTEIDQTGPKQVEARFSVDAGDFPGEEVERVGDAEIRAVARKGDLPGEYLLAGEVTYTADLRCSRCAEPYPFANSASFTVRYRPLPPGSEQPSEVELGDEELETEFYSEPQVPLRQVAVDQIQLSLPMKPLCDEGCQGLCPKCGANLNRGKCNCNENVFDDRWSALQGLRDQLNKKKDV